MAAPLWGPRWARELEPEKVTGFEEEPVVRAGQVPEPVAGRAVVRPRIAGKEDRPRHRLKGEQERGPQPVAGGGQRPPVDPVIGILDQNGVLGPRVVPKGIPG